MDQEVLVNQQIEDGLALISKLAVDGFDVTVAFWAKLSDGGMWYLYIGTVSLDTMPTADFWRAVSDTLQQVRPRSIAISDVRFIRATDPSAIAAIEASERFMATRFRKSSLGNLAIDDAYIYPKPSGPMGRSSVVHRVASLMTGTGTLAPHLIILRDGMRMYAVPVAMQMTTAGGVDVVWHDVDADVDRSISADEVASIETGRRTPTLMKLIR